MKISLFVVALALVSACSKQNDVAVLQHEATALAKYYLPKVEALDARVNAIMERGKTIPGTVPGVREVGARVQEARDTLAQLRGIVGPSGDQKSATGEQKSMLEKLADEAAQKKNVADLRKLVHDTESALARGVTIVNTNLDSAESWIAYYDRRALATQAPQAEPGAPEAQGTPATGQPPAAAQPGTPAPAQPTPAPAQPAPAPAQPARP